MSSIGTGIAMSVASVAHNARKAGESCDKQRTDAGRAAQRDGDQFLHKLEAAASAEDPDAELPDRQAPGYEQLYLLDSDGEPLGDPGPPPSAELYEAHPDGTVGHADHPLYRHLDVTA